MENLQNWMKKTQNKSGINSLPKEVAVGQGRQKDIEFNGKTESVLW